MNHDKLVDVIKQELIVRGYNPEDHIEYGDPHKLTGEIDLMARKGKYILLFVMKSNYTFRLHDKAINQLNRAKDYLFKDYRVFKFSVFGRRWSGIGPEGYDLKWEK